MRRYLIAVLAPLLLALPGCTMTGLLDDVPTAPVELADRTSVDEQVGLTVTLAYTAASKVAALSIETGVITDRATIRKIGALDRTAFAAVEAVEAAYRTGNAESYAAALRDARKAVAALLNPQSGEPT